MIPHEDTAAEPEEAATTAWAAEPERVDPDEYPPSAPFARQMTWAPCAECELQVHLPVTQFVYRGLNCPRCGQELLPPPAEPDEWLRRVLREEDEFAEQLS